MSEQGSSDGASAEDSSNSSETVNNESSEATNTNARSATRSKGGSQDAKDGDDADEGNESDSDSNMKSKAKSKSKDESILYSKPPGSGMKSSNGSKAKSKNESVAKSKNESVAKSKNDSVAKSKNDSVVKSKNESVAKSKNESVAKSKHGSVSNSSSCAKSKEDGSCDKSKFGSAMKSSQAKSKTKDRSSHKSKDKSKKKSKSKAKSKSKSKTKSKTQDKSKMRSITSAKSARNKSSSGDMKMTKVKKINIGVAKIGFVGAGKMADAIVRGLINVAKIDPKKIFVAAKTSRNLEIFQNRGITVTKRSYDIFGQYDCDIVFLCVHGYVIKGCFKLGGTRPFAFTINYIPNQKHPLFVLSLIGGIFLNDIKLTLLDPDNPDKYFLEMHRIMLNIGVGYGLGMGALDVNVDSKQCHPVVRDLLTSITKLEYLPEQLMDAACCLGGNGLAFCYYFIAAIADGGFKMGLNKVIAIRFAAKTLQSAAQCLLESNKHPSELQDSVISQAGPAIYGVHILDKADCASGFQAAISTAYKRLKELVDLEPITEIEHKVFMGIEQRPNQ